MAYVLTVNLQFNVMLQESLNCLFMDCSPQKIKTPRYFEMSLTTRIYQSTKD